MYCVSAIAEQEVPGTRSQVGSAAPPIIDRVTPRSSKALAVVLR